MQRKAWKSLNGPWEFDCTSLTGAAPSLNRTLKQTILVPFPVESYLSGKSLCPYLKVILTMQVILLFFGQCATETAVVVVEGTLLTV